MRNCPGLVSLPGIVLLLASVSPAQDYRARVQGVIADSTKAVVAGAKVRLRNTDTGIAHERESAPTGHFLFDFVEPGNYEIEVEMDGFNKYVQQNIRVQVRADVSVNPILTLGAVVETVTVAAAPVEVQFNTSTMSLTVDRKMLTDLPVLARNPFTLALLDPAVVNRYTSNLATRNPFYMWSSSSLDVGGNTTRRNDLQLDGAPLQLGWKGSYAPPMDATQEVSVQQNAVDAEYGHSAGGVLSLSMKSGTNEYHGTAYYFGRNPALNAVTNSVVRAPNAVRNHIWGGTLGNPIIRNKLFTFTSYEQWKTKDPRQQQFTLPTELERTGNFSQSLNAAGALRAIYDPWTTTLTGATANRMPFAGNIIPTSRIDPSSRIVLGDIWAPNGPGVGPTGANNYQVAYFWFLNNWNFSNRTDYNPNDKWKLFGRYSRFRTDLDQSNYSPNNSPAARNDNGGVMHSRNIAGDAVYTMNATTVLNFRFSYASLNDDYDAPSSKVGEAGLQKVWPSNAWYKPYLEGIPAIYYPEMVVTGNGSAAFGKGGWWFQHPSSYNYSGRVSKNAGIHYMKWGGESRLTRGNSVRPNLMNFSFGPALTADTFLAPDTRQRGDAWATFLLGALDSSSQSQFVPLQKAWTDFYGIYFHDDIKLTRNLTLNLGLRYEYETGVYDADDRLSRQLDLTSPIPEFQNNPPALPAAAAALRAAPPIYNGAWQFVSSDRRSSWDSPKNIFMPRAGMALRLNNQTALRAGFARYVVPPILTTDTLGSAQYPGFSAITSVAPVLQGVPQARLSDPFPANSNPLVAPVNRSLGRYTNLGNAANWNKQNFRSGVNDRINISLQRQLPNDIHVDLTYFMNFGRDMPYNLAVNQADPNIIYANGAAVDRSVPNPFFGILTPEQFPGQLRNQRNVRVRDLLTPYPQYGALTQFNTDGVLNRYHALQVKVQRAFAGGYMFLVGYNYNRERTSNFFNDIDQFAGRFTYLDSNNPRHRVSAAGTYELPVGKGRKHLAAAHPVVDAVLGGWAMSGMLFANTGGFLRFGAMQASGSPRIDNPTRDRYFDTSKFARQPAYTPRSNPFQYSDLTGWFNWNLDTTLSKFFKVTERVKLELRLEAYNLTNSFVPTDPNTNVLQPTFGRSLSQINRGREFQYTGRIHF